MTEGNYLLTGKEGYLGSSLLRIPSIDILRGLALGGILLVNLSSISGTSRIQGSQGLDWVAAFFITFLVTGKVYPIFAFLFGWGVGRRQQSWSGNDFFQRNFRRMTALAVIGLLHGMFIWQGDILLMYAIVGMLLPLLQRARAGSIVFLAGTAMSASSLLALPVFGDTAITSYLDFVSPISAPLRFHLSGISTLFISDNSAGFLLKLVYAPFWAGSTIGLSILGYAVGAGKIRIKPTRAKQAAFLMAGLALIANLVYVLVLVDPSRFPPDWTGFLRESLLGFGGPLLALTYSNLVISRLVFVLGRPFLEYLGFVGRMSLTTYLIQTTTCIFVVSVTGRGALTPVMVCLFSAIFFSLQVGFCHVWLARFPRGPAETVWRYLSGDLQREKVIDGRPMA